VGRCLCSIETPPSRILADAEKFLQLSGAPIERYLLVLWTDENHYKAAWLEDEIQKHCRCSVQNMSSDQHPDCLTVTVPTDLDRSARLVAIAMWRLIPDPDASATATG